MERVTGIGGVFFRSARPDALRLWYAEHLGLELASLLDAQESIPWFIEFVFAVHGRVRPFNKWLEWELERHPLPVDVVRLERLERIARTGDLGEQQAQFRDAERLAREHGLGHVIDGWEPDLALLRGDP